MNSMSIENQENYDRLIRWLSNYAFQHKIGLEFKPNLPSYAPPTSFNFPGNLIIMNRNWIPKTEIPFSFAHEIGHVLLEYAPYYNCAYLGKDKGEYAANIFAINLLKQYCQENEYHYNNIYSFANSFGIPSKVRYLLK